MKRKKLMVAGVIGAIIGIVPGLLIALPDASNDFDRMLVAGIGMLLGSAIGCGIVGMFSLEGDLAASAHRRSKEDDERNKRAMMENETHFLRYLFSILAKLANADGHIDAEEVAIVRRLFEKFEFAAKRKEYCISIFNRASADKQSIYEYARLFSRRFYDEATRIFLYELLWDVACADGVLHPSERLMLKQICSYLQLSDFCFSVNYMQRRALFTEATGTAETAGPEKIDEREYVSGRSSIRDAYAILGCVPGMTDAQIKEAYKVAAMKCHPDRLRQNGVPESMISWYSGRMAQINAAWNDIQKARRK